MAKQTKISKIAKKTAKKAAKKAAKKSNTKVDRSDIHQIPHFPRRSANIKPSTGPGLICPVSPFSAATNARVAGPAS